MDDVYNSILAKLWFGMIWHNTIQLFECLKLKEYLGDEERRSIEKICAKYADIFHISGDKLTVKTLSEYQIKLQKDATPVYVKPYRIPHAQKSELTKQVNKLLNEDIIEECTSEWSSPLLLLPKKLDSRGEKRWRNVIDYRRPITSSIVRK